MKEEKEVYKIINNHSSKVESVRFPPTVTYETDFDSIKSARSANCHGEYKKKDEYRIAKYKVTYELINDDCDPITKDDQVEIDKRLEDERVFNENLQMKAKEIYDKDIKELNYFEHLDVHGAVIKLEFEKFINKLVEECK